MIVETITIVVLTWWFALGTVAFIVWSIALLFTTREPEQQLNYKQWLLLSVVLIFGGGYALYEVCGDIETYIKTR